MPEELSAAVAAEIRRLCEDLGWSGRELARRLNMSTNTTAAKLRGDSPFTLDEVDAIAAVAGADAADLISRAQARRS